MRNRNIIALSIFTAFYVSFGVFLSLNQETFIYHPFSQDFASCFDFTNASKVTFKETRMYVNEITKPVVVLYHGNAGSACDRDFYANLFSQAGYGYIIVEYAGYSNDPKPPTHNLIKQNVKDVISYLRENEISNVTVVGESIGTGVAAYHTSLAPPEKLLLISPFTDLAEIAREHFWFYPTSLLVNNAFDNVANLNGYNGKVMILHGTTDNIIPHQLGGKLFQALEADKDFVSILNAGHNDLFSQQETYEAIQNFLKQE